MVGNKTDKKMADDDDLEYSETNVGSAQAQGVRKNISIKLKGKGRGRGRKSVRGRRTASAKKTVIGSTDEDEQPQPGEDVTAEETATEKQVSDTVSLDEVISKLETPSFSPMERAFPEPVHQNKKLRWNHKVNLIGEKVVNPTIHCCEKCSLPILNYGRMIPCKHVFCYECAKRSDNVCPKCEEKVAKVEQTALGSVFMCTFGGSRLGPVACGRTYLSQRDLQAHINHRHLKPASAPANTAAATTTACQTTSSHITTNSTVPSNVNLVPSHAGLARDPRDPRGHAHDMHPGQAAVVGLMQHSHSHVEHREQGDHSRGSAMSTAGIPPSNPAGQTRQYAHASASYPTPVPVSSARPNLITVPIQDDSASSTSTSSQHSHQQPHQQYTQASGAPAHPLPMLQQQQHPPGSYPPPHAYQHSLPVSANYSQAPPLTGQHPPPPSVHHPPPPMHASSVPMYSTPPPPVHHPSQTSYTTPPAAPPPHTSHTLPPQRFPGGAGYEEPSYIQPWTSGSVPPPSRAPMPPPRPMGAAPPPPAGANHNLSCIPPRGPSDQTYRPPYYQ